MKGTYVERDRKKEKKKVKAPDSSGSKKNAQGAAASMVGGVPGAMAVSSAVYVVLLWVVLSSVGIKTNMLDVLHLLGNASYEPGPSYDAHARSATLYAPAWHDAPPGDGTWSDASRCHDAWTNASAGNAWASCCHGKNEM